MIEMGDLDVDESSASRTIIEVRLGNPRGWRLLSNFDFISFMSDTDAFAEREEERFLKELES